MRVAALVPALVLALAAVPFAVVHAEDGTPPGAGADGKKAEAKKDDAKLRVDRAQQMVKELEEAVARVKATQPIDAALLGKLMEALEQAKALAKPAKPPELTEAEKQAVLDEAKEKGDAGKPKDGASEWQERALARAFEGADLSEEEEVKAKKVVGDWYSESMSSMGDSKKQSDLKRRRDDDLEKAVGKKKAQKIINNLNSMGPGRR